MIERLRWLRAVRWIQRGVSILYPSAARHRELQPPVGSARGLLPCRGVCHESQPSVDTGRSDYAGKSCRYQRGAWDEVLVSRGHLRGGRSQPVKRAGGEAGGVSHAIGLIRQSHPRRPREHAASFLRSEDFRSRERIASDGRTCHEAQPFIRRGQAFVRKVTGAKSAGNSFPLF